VQLSIRNYEIDGAVYEIYELGGVSSYGSIGAPRWTVEPMTMIHL